MARGKYKRRRERKILRAVSISELEFGTRLTNILQKNDIYTLADLSAMTANQIKDIPGLGVASYSVICQKLAEHNIVLK